MCKGPIVAKGDRPALGTNGSLVVRPKRTQAYMVSCRGLNGGQAINSVLVSVAGIVTEPADRRAARATAAELSLIAMHCNVCAVMEEK